MVITPQPQVPLQDMQPVGPNATAWNRVRSGSAATIRDAQTFLGMHGYKLATDGKWGPQTATALKAYFRNMNPHEVNHILAGFRQKLTLKPANQRPPMAKAPPGPPARVPRGRGSRGGGGGRRPPVGASAGVPNPYGDPTKIANSYVNAEYGPAISQLKNLLGDVGNQDRYNQKQITGYYQQMKNLMNSQNAEQGASTSAAEQQVANAIGNDAQLFGGANAGALAPDAANAAGYLGAVGKSQQDYLSNMLPLLNAQAATGTANEQNAAHAQQQNYQDQLAAQQHAKGQAWTQAYQQAVSSQAQQQQNQLALQEAQSMLPYKMQAAKYGAQAAKYGAQSAAVGAKYAGQNAALGVAAKGAQLQHYQALTAQEMASAKKDIAQAKAAAKGKDAVNVLAPGSTTAQRIQSSLYKAMTNGKGRVVIQNPMVAQRALFQNAIQQGLIDRQGRPLVPGVTRLLNATLLNMYNRDPGWRARYKWNGRTFVAKG